MKIDRQCRWVRHRLPLLAGGELGVDERRKVERHLIGCPDCQACRGASTDALTALRSAALVSPAMVDAPSLWPALATQIRQSRHASPRLPWWEMPLPQPWAFVSLATGLIAVLVASIVPTSNPDQGPDQSSPSIPVAVTQVLASPPKIAPAPSRPGALPQGQAIGLSQNTIKPIEPPSSILRFDYDLDHGTPMSPGSRDSQRAF